MPRCNSLTFGTSPIKAYTDAQTIGHESVNTHTTKGAAERGVGLRLAERGERERGRGRGEERGGKRGEGARGKLGCVGRGAHRQEAVAPHAQDVAHATGDGACNPVLDGGAELGHLLRDTPGVAAAGS